jgi:ABC-2 type transport system ATP-binding protein
MLELRNVSKHYSSIPVVEDVSFSALAGEVTGYLGPNGSGKSSTMKMITGLIEMSSGSILFQGKPIQDDLMAYKQRMGYVPEEPHLYAHLSGVEYLVMVGQLRDLHGGWLPNASMDCCAPLGSTTTGMCRSPRIPKECARRSYWPRPC